MNHLYLGWILNDYLRNKYNEYSDRYAAIIRTNHSIPQKSMLIYNIIHDRVLHAPLPDSVIILLRRRYVRPHRQQGYREDHSSRKTGNNLCCHLPTEARYDVPKDRSHIILSKKIRGYPGCGYRLAKYMFR